MIRLLQIEFIKLWNNRASKVLIISYFALLTSIALVAAIKFDIGPIKFHLADQGIFNFPYIWHFNTFITAFFKLFLAIVIVSMMSNEYSNKTIKQNLIDGLSKKEFILSKFLTVITFSLVSTIFVFIVSLILGLFYSDFNELSIIFTDLEFLLAFFVKLTGFFSFCLFLGVLVKRSAFALGFLILWQVFEGIFRGILRWKFFDGETTDSIMNLFPLQSMFNLIKEPFSRLGAVQSVANQMGEKLALNYHVHWYEVIIVLFWTAIFIYGSYKILKRRDL
ncbi:ABC transporter permease [Maribacter dokdonensis]|uniref:ABC-type transport system involved in multi-copper enzyme maturation, permease component n=1 Tax=Maribacter dokdonensis TaxID=320912 RepID=A0A1H4PFI2_9FLAO|nr:ABC transporter permease subunit [Maribacter dokdonensis]MBU2899695.1 ABC transporter permease [Maribacter dokdonensis]MDP2526980.1 ABC transporter permease subunit [Maribacter dokdonensis]CAG2532213.1 ABC-type transport system involved in multi-copper enzyme maturation [Maribacter dokdonensis]SDS87623.1 ABC-type transport system involved in multi-copper enzyme maturation, permease component [Maribacter dokdonensis]SEC06177.1 ABC-type transport system involved in multi-copper enzyme maturat